MQAAWARQSLTWPGTTARASPMYAQDARMIIVGSITGNSNTIGGGFVYPKANLGGQIVWLGAEVRQHVNGRRFVACINEDEGFIAHKL